MSDNELIVRTATADDFDAICHVYDDVIAVNTGSQYDVLWDRSQHPSDDQIRKAIAADFMYLVLLDGECMGVGIVNDDFAEGYDQAEWKLDLPLSRVRCLHLFATHPSVEGRGVATRFLEGIIAAERARGIQAIRLDAFDYNKPARHLYEKLGFQYCGLLELDYEDQDSEGWVFAMYELDLRPASV